jgi:hypothetical protein
MTGKPDYSCQGLVGCDVSEDLAASIFRLKSPRNVGILPQYTILHQSPEDLNSSQGRCTSMRYNDKVNIRSLCFLIGHHAVKAYCGVEV